MDATYAATPEIQVLPSHLPVPGLGVIPVNAYLLRAAEPVLIDTGMEIDREPFLQELWSLIDPEELRWVFLTHDDNDHAGNLREVLEAAPHARVALNWISKARIEDHWDIPLDRVHFLNPGQRFSAGDRDLVTLRPPIFDGPGSLALYDGASDVLFAADSFGALIPEPAQEVGEVPETAYQDGFRMFQGVLSPWVTLVDQGKFDQTLEPIQEFQPRTILSAHGPVAHERTPALLEAMSAIPSAEPFVGPDQAALEAMLAEMAHGEAGA